MANGTPASRAPSTAPPPGYFDAGAQQGPPPGYFDASQAQAAPAGRPQLSDYLKTDDTGVVAGVRRGIAGLVGLPSTVYHAFKEPTTPEEAEAMARNSEPIYGRGRGTLETAVHRLIAGPLEQEGGAAAEAKSQGRLVDYLGHAAMSYIPLLGPMAGQAVSRSEKGDTSGAIAELLTVGLGAKGIEKVTKAPAAARPLLQKYWNVGPELTADTVAKSSAEAADTAGKYQEKVEAARQVNEAAKQSYLERQQLQTEAMGHARELAEHLPRLAEQQRAFAKSLYPEIDGTVDSGELSGKLQDAIDSKLRGSEKAPAVLTRIMKELEPEDPLAGYGKGARNVSGTPLDELPPSARARIMQSMSEGERGAYRGEAGEPLDFDRVHGYYSELGREMANRDLPGDERAAMANARGVLEQTMRKMAEGDNQLGRFVEAQKNWKQYENTFNKSWSDSRGVASPVARVLQAKNPATGELIPERVAQILADPKNYKLAQELLGKFKGAKTDVLQLMKEKLEQAGTLPKSLKETPLPPAPTAPEPIDPRALKVAALQKSAQGLRSMQGIRGSLDVVALVHALMGNPKALLYPILRRGLSYGLQSPRVMNYLTEPSEAELRMVKPSDVYMSKKAIPKPKVSDKAAAAAALASNHNKRDRD